MYVINYLWEEVRGECYHYKTSCYSASKDVLQDYLVELFEELKIVASKHRGHAIVMSDSIDYKQVWSGRDCDDFKYTLSIDTVKPLNEVRGI